MKLSTYYPKMGTCLLSILLCTACQQESALYKKHFTEKEKAGHSSTLINGAGTDLYYQGTAAERGIILEAQKLNPNNGDVYRELGVPYLKRGFAVEANDFYEQAVELKPEEWQGYWGYCILYFYRDYEKALVHLEEMDARTPDFIDYPQSTSVEYMKGLCHLHMGNYNRAIEHLNKHIEFEVKSGNEKYLDLARTVLANAFIGLKNYIKAEQILKKAIDLSGGNAEVWYYYALNHYYQKNKSSATKALDKSKELFESGHSLGRSYVSEFYQIYQEDIDRLQTALDKSDDGNIRQLGAHNPKNSKTLKYI